MTIGTAIVISVALLCVTFIATICIGANLAKQKQTTANRLTEEILKRKNKI